MSILSGIKSWAPFKIDALGIITLLGSQNVRQSISCLSLSPLAEYLPILAPQIIADNSIAISIPGFMLYNITDGVAAMDLCAWWTNWLFCQSLSWNSSTFYISSSDSSGKVRASSLTITYLLVVLNITLDVALIIIPVFLEDWYGFAASVGVVVTIITRVSVLSLFRRSLDTLVLQSMDDRNPVKLFILLPNGKAVTVLTTRGIATKCLLTEPRPQNNTLHLIIRSIHWTAFGVLVVCLGMACLCMQIIIVTVMLLATILVFHRICCDESRVGRYLKIEQVEGNYVEDSRRRAYIRLDLSEEEEESMIRWHLFPMRSNNFWWTRYLNDKSEKTSIGKATR
jgi:hypothetical protein